MVFDAYESWLNITAADRPPTYYDLLGLAPFESDPEIIEQAALRRMGKVRQHHIGPHSDLSQQILAELALARLVLSDPDRRGDYDAKLKARGVEPFADLRPAASGTASKCPASRSERFGRLHRLMLATLLGIPFLVWLYNQKWMESRTVVIRPSSPAAISKPEPPNERSQRNASFRNLAQERPTPAVTKLEPPDVLSERIPTPPQALPAGEVAKPTPPVASVPAPTANPTVAPPGLIETSTGMQMVLIPAGRFLMGSDVNDNDAEEDEKPQRRVSIPTPFYLGKYEVTVGQFRQFVQDEGYKTEGERDGIGGFGFVKKAKEFKADKRFTWKKPGFPQDDNHPVVMVSHNDAQAFVQWLSRKDGKTFRLPTESEWEYAARARTMTRFSSGDDPEILATVGNIYDGTAKKKFPVLFGRGIKAQDHFVYTAPVGRFNPNNFGLYDMHGNVFEWCSDCLDASAARDVKARVYRGGSWNVGFEGARSADRSFGNSHASGCDVGFRVARSVDDEIPVVSRESATGSLPLNTPRR
jgi:formylglycine-generating enzyme